MGRGSESIMKRYIEVYALRRSGCHAVLNWLFNQFDDPVLFFNNAIPKQDPLIRMRSSGNLQNILELEPYYHNRLPRNEIRTWDISTVSVLYEDYTDINSLTTISDWINPDQTFRIMIFRDFQNWMASRIRWTLNRKMKIDYEDFIRRWKIHAYHFLHNPCLIKIYYNSWKNNFEYRKSTLDSISIPLKNDDISHIPNFGGGSSFTPVSYGARRAKSDGDYDNRYLYLDNFPDLQRMIKEDEELNTYIEQIDGGFK